MLKDFVAYQLAKKFFKWCKTVKLPRALKGELYSASYSVALNLAEGSGKRTAAEQQRFYGIALGSLRECEAILDLEDIVLNAEMDEIRRRLGAILFKLSRGGAGKEKPKPNPSP